MQRLIRLLAAMSLAAGLAACIQPPEAKYPALTYTHLPPLDFDVAAVEVEQAYQPKSAPPNVELMFPVQPGAAAANWGRDRLRATGASRKLRYVVSEASVIEVPLKLKGGLAGAVQVEQSERYEARLVVNIELRDDGRVLGSANAEVARTVTVPEDATLTEREQTWYRLTQKLMDDMNRQLEEILKKAFFRFMR